MTNHSPIWRIAVDTGGTFTDAVATDPRGRRSTIKVLSSSRLRARVESARSPKHITIDLPGMAIRAGGLVGMSVSGPLVSPVSDRSRATRTAQKGNKAPEAGDGTESAGPPVLVIAHTSRAPLHSLILSGPVRPSDTIDLISQEQAPILAARLLTSTPASDPLPDMELRVATTRATNALLERTGEPVALFITHGFADLLDIGDQTRPDLFALDIIKPAPLHSHVVEVIERIRADGAVQRPIDLDTAVARARRVLADGVTSAAIALLHSWNSPAHELALERALRDLGFEHIARSSDLSAGIRILWRAQTAVADAYVAPVMRAYLDRIRAALSPGSRARVLTSAGGLADAQTIAPKDALLSGPAGGVIGAIDAARRAGFHRVITLDMGGTSTDVARCDGDRPVAREHRVGDARIMSPAVAVETVGAGGGSICRFHRGTLEVGPQSAGADPGPACYGAGGPLTITDANLLLGRIDPTRFGVPIDAAAAQRALDRLAAQITSQRQAPLDQSSLLHALIDLADERMAEAIRRITIRQGADPADYALVAFGGAGPQHACAVAQRLGIARVIVPRDASLLSAHGVAASRLERIVAQQVLRPLAAAAPDLPDMLRDAESEALARLAAENVELTDAHVTTRELFLRLLGQDTTIAIALDADDGERPLLADIESRFRVAYHSLHGRTPPDRPIELESIRVSAAARPPAHAESPAPAARPGAANPSAQRSAASGPPRPSIPSLDRASLTVDTTHPGPALILEDTSVTVVPPGWTLRLDASGPLILERADTAAPVALGQSDAAQAEIVTHRLASIATEMGERLQFAAISVNVKERLDFSCAILDAAGELLVNAPHVPVHLGSLGLCVRSLRAAIEMQEGDAIVTNHPALGGTHLPDITVVCPVHVDGQLFAHVAARAHHAELGGISPGSMPAGATSLAQEGVLIPPMYLVRREESRWDHIRRVLTTAPHPTRAVEENLADLAAALVACHRGRERLVELIRALGPQRAVFHVEHLKDRAHKLLTVAIGRLPPGERRGVERLDDGSEIHVRIHIRPDSLDIDFSGSAAVHPGNLNATPAIVRSAVVYLLRLLVNEPIPLNEGLMRAVRLTIPRPSILDPEFPQDARDCPAVAAGNVETSQRLVNLLVRTLRLAADSQGTMNNVAFGGDGFSCYETICGGAGATPHAPGASAVHSHMTNTRITDPEVLEQRLPVLLERFEIRRGSGGDGAHRGGDGARREYRFLKSARVSVLGQHRTSGPAGLAGGLDGDPGAEHVIRANGQSEVVVATSEVVVEPGDRLVIDTPGGGGWGSLPPAHAQQG